MVVKLNPFNRCHSNGWEKKNLPINNAKNIRRYGNGKMSIDPYTNAQPKNDRSLFCHLHTCSAWHQNNLYTYIKSSVIIRVVHNIPNIMYISSVTSSRFCTEKKALAMKTLPSAGWNSWSLHSDGWLQKGQIDKSIIYFFLNFTNV